MNDRGALVRLWKMLVHEIAFRKEHTDLTDPDYYDGYWQATLELCHVEDQLGIPHSQPQRVN